MSITTWFCPTCGAANEFENTRCFACGQKLESSAEKGTSQEETLLLERYRLGTILGAGGFSTVYRALDLLDGEREVAIKQINLSGLSAEEKIEATNTFNREVNLLSALNHPQVPHIYANLSDAEHWYLALEYIDGSTLEVYLQACEAQGKAIQLDETLDIGTQLCTVLEYLHSRQPPVIFRDLKPGNIMRTSRGKLYLIDFGIARHFRPGQARDTQPLGSPGYAAPEQYGRAQTTPQTDIYSLGALLHQLLSGQDPSEHPQGLAPLRLGGSGAEAELAALVGRMLSPAPEGRPSSIREVTAALAQIRQQHAEHQGKRIWLPPVPQDYPSSTYAQKQIQIQHLRSWQTAAPAPRRRLLTRRRALAGLASAAVVAATWGGVSWWINSHEPAPPTGVSVYKGHTGPVYSVAWSNDGSLVASASQDYTIQTWQATSGRNVTTFQGHMAPVNAVAWSPDGQQLASASSDGTVKIWDAASGHLLYTYSGHNGTVDAVDWSPDGQRIASASQDQTVHIWQAKDGINANIYKGHTDRVTSVAWSPDSSYIASGSADRTVHIWGPANGRTNFIYTGHSATVNAVVWDQSSQNVASGSDDNSVQIWNAASGTQAFIYPGHTAPVNAVAWSPNGSLIASGSNDDTVQIWLFTNGQQIFTYTGHTASVNTVSWSPDGSLIASGSSDETAQVWRVPQSSTR